MPIESIRWKDKGDKLLDKGFFEDSIICFEMALELSPDDIDLWINRGLALSNLGDKEDAIESFDKAIELDPEDTLAWNNKGVALDDLGRHQEATGCYDRVIEIDPNDADAWSNKGVSFGLLGQFDRAIECFETAIRIDASNAPAWYNRGMTLNALRRNDEQRLHLPERVSLVTGNSSQLRRYALPTHHLRKQNRYQQTQLLNLRRILKKEEYVWDIGTPFFYSSKTYVSYVRVSMHIDLDNVRWREPHA